MTPEQDFDRRLAGIHGLDPAAGNGPVAASASVSDIRHDELTAMFDAFLGADYDPNRRQRVEALQLEMQKKQADLANRHEVGQLTDDQYVAAANALIEESFRQCERTLGKDDFAKLFGGPAEAARRTDQPSDIPGANG